MTENNSNIKAEHNSSVTIYNHSNINSSDPKDPKTKFSSAANIAAVVVALATVLGLIYTIYKDGKKVSETTDEHSTKDTTITTKKDSVIVIKPIAPDIKKNHQFPAIIPTVKPLPSSFAVVEVNDELDHFDAELSKRVADIFNQKNYKDIHVSSNPSSSNYKNTVIGKLILSNIDSSRRTDLYKNYKYTFDLEIMFRDSNGRICDQRKYSSVLSLQESNPKNISKEQAIIDLLAKFAIEKDIPFCVK